MIFYNESQRAMIAARRVETVRGDNQHNERVTQGVAAASCNISRVSVQRALIVLKRGTDHLIDLVDNGLVSVHRASELCKNLNHRES